MKTKNISLALAAALLSAGSVFATLVPESGYLRFRNLGEIEIRCKPLGICDTAGNIPCRIRVNGTDYHAFKSDCVTLIMYTTSTVIATLNDPNIAQMYNTPL